MQTLPFAGRIVAYPCKGLDQSIIVCEYEVNMSTNEKVITEKQNFNTNCLRTLLNIRVIWRSRSQCWWKGLDLSNIVCEYAVNLLTTDTIITEIQNFNAKW